MRANDTNKIAIGGLLAALAIVIMCLGGLVPVFTYVCPVLCILIGNVVLKKCGRRLAWAWYFAVSILSLLLATDREAAVVYTLLGAYPYIKPFFDRFKLKLLLKLVYFNISILMAYSFLLLLFGLSKILHSYTQLGRVGILIILVLGNITFFMLDILLGRDFKKK